MYVQGFLEIVTLHTGHSSSCRIQPAQTATCPQSFSTVSTEFDRQTTHSLSSVASNIGCAFLGREQRFDFKKVVLVLVLVLVLSLVLVLVLVPPLVLVLVLVPAPVPVLVLVLL